MQQVGLRALMVNTQVLGLVSALTLWLTAIRNFHSRGYVAFSGLQGHIRTWYTNIHTGKINVKVEK